MFKEIQPSELYENLFNLIKDEWGVITLDCDTKVNGMTVNWVQMGYLWRKYVVTLYVRPQRYTYKYIQNKDNYSLAFFDGYRKELNYLGSSSGHDEDKIKTSGLTISYDNETPYINEAKIIFILKKLYSNTLKEENFIEDGLKEKIYPNNDFHLGIVCEIEKILIKE